MFILPELKKSYSSYEPYIDKETMETHHKKHHAGYVEKLNKELVEIEYESSRIEDIFENITEISVGIRNNAGGHYNHTVFWSVLTDTMTTPSEELMDLISAKFGLINDFKNEFTKEALSVFGSGWVWLVLNKSGELEITTTKNQDNPLMSDIDTGYPLFGLDVWEHAYYLKYKNERSEYINAFWSVLDWNEISSRLSKKPEMNSLF